MAIVATMPGNWPKEDPREENTSDDLVISLSPYQPPEMKASISSPSSIYEFYYDAPEGNEASSTSYLSFEPVVSSISETEPADNWRRYDPPRELLHFQDGTPTIVRDILEPSIDILRARHTAEIEKRAASRQDKPLGRSGRASMKPRREVMMSGALDPSAFTHNPQSSQSSEVSLAPSDSGYGSGTPEINASDNVPSNADRAEKNIFSSISARFKVKRKNEASNHLKNDSKISCAPVLPNIKVSSDEWPLKDGVILEESMKTGECVSCLDDFSSGSLIKLSCHSYCADCFQRLVSNALESETHWPVKCCLSPIPYSIIEPHLDIKTQGKYSRREAEWSIPVGDRIYCAHPNCSTFISPKRINKKSNSAKCRKCSRATCTSCRGISHSGADCPEDPSLRATINLAEQEGWKRCYSCHALVEHNNGCRHMTCRCKAQFCYICGLRWRTCGCTDTQLVHVHEQAAIRRNEQAERAAREAAAAEEERIVLQMVEDFERREAEREAAEAEARWRREEEERVAGIDARYRSLNTQLELLHGVQRVLVSERHGFEQETLQKERQDALDILSIRHLEEARALSLDSEAKIVDLEHKFDMEFRVLLAAEQKLEEQYVEELKEFWKGQPNGELKVREARNELRNDQDKEYKSWETYRRAKMQAITEGERKKSGALEAKQRSEVKVAEGRAQINEIEGKKNWEAEEKWIKAVVSERSKILYELEREEYAQVTRSH